MKQRKPVDVASTLVHEMVHLWQAERGKPSRTGYHNKEGAAKMRAVGLIPSSTGEPGGAEVGQRMTHYVEPGGVFERAFNEMPDDHALPWTCEAEPSKKKKEEKKNKVKYTCPGCGANAWGKPDLAIMCEVCEESLEAES